jgi:pyrroline-5-carboxylate reductase
MSAVGAALRVGFVGAGQMATALARGFCQAGLTEPGLIVAADPAEAARVAFARATSAKVTPSNSEAAQGCDVLVLAVKPQQMPAALRELTGIVGPGHLVISIAAGVTLDTMAAALGAGQRLVRVMPNTPCLVGASAAAYCLGGAATSDDAQLVERLLGAVGLALQLPESLLDAVTGLSGSGPAFVYVMIEALADGGVRAGLPRDVALRLAAQTVLGAARMVLSTGQHPAALKDAVASPGGTTIAGLHELERLGVRGALMNAVLAAATRSRELGQTAR